MPYQYTYRYVDDNSSISDWTYTEVIDVSVLPLSESVQGMLEVTYPYSEMIPPEQSQLVNMGKPLKDL